MSTASLAVDLADVADLLGVDIDPAADPIGFVAALRAAVAALAAQLDGTAPPAPPQDIAAAKVRALGARLARDLKTKEARLGLDLAKTATTTTTPPPAPRTTTPHRAHGLTEREIAKCKAKGVDPAALAKTKAAIAARSGRVS